MIHPDTELRWIGDEVGHGVFATRPIPRGAIVWTLCRLDIVLSPAQVRALGEPYRKIFETWSYRDASGDSVLAWDHGRYVNHSCEPAMLPVGHRIEIAARDLAPGDELTCDYRVLNWTAELHCRCGRAACRGGRAAQSSTADGSFNDAVRAALRCAAAVAQPLLPYVQDLAEWEDYACGRRALLAMRDYQLAAG